MTKAIMVIFLFLTVLAVTAPIMQPAAYANENIRFGIITDIHHTNKADTAKRKYSCAYTKLQRFIYQMEAEQVDFIIELGDLVDTLECGKEATENLAEVEQVFTSFPGPVYHVTGNHEFDDLPRDLFLNSIKNSGIPQGQTYYSWNSNGVHFIVLDASYTIDPPHKPFDMARPEGPFRNWQDAYIPAAEIAWLENDLQENQLPVIIFTHQTLHNKDTEEHNIKNSSVIRKMLEEDGKVMAVFSGHYHKGDYAAINGIHYLVLKGNVEVHEPGTLAEGGHIIGCDPVTDNQFAVVEISRADNGGMTLSVQGYGHQPSYQFHCYPGGPR